MKEIESLLKNVELLDKRAYFTVDSEGKIKRKAMNFSVPAVAFLTNQELVEKTICSEISKVERLKFKKIDRMSNLSIETLKENLIKLIINGNLEFAKKYGKELALRDRNEFYKTLAKIALMDNMDFLKPLMVLSLKEILGETQWFDEVWHLVVNYLVKQRADLRIYENSLKIEKINKKTLIEEARKSSNLKVISYGLLLSEYELPMEENYLYILKEELSNSSRREEDIREIEGEIIKSLFLRGE
ncbi:hypothetical protein [Cetobacterium sp. SF1]|uniref:hypothetical protein n=1 Tax=unclassified Cetobacterium TaxID=2630983 RepID=UPI003CF54E98